ncbi:GIY-YIG nuclease family protein [Rhizobium sp. WW_1]|jgi:hypothetical protein|uniref:GIY-YIG nuclease family protein n=1 Tax=Rhizobium sp. WW_1 TaxID=1907375 RepID=UPI0006480E6E|nr:GIY-YIG nuclease family protein [Rhizobium sp. WW_1]RKD69002.1 Meiotically Up-regulated Gene 113 (MUG113) protein [Rhizobium sp. WW_1]
MISRTSLANEIDEYDQQIADMNTGKKDCFDAYRAQLVASGMDKANIKTEIEAIKAAIKRRRAAKKDPMAVEEKDALIDEIFEEITTSPRAPRATYARESEYRGPRKTDVFDEIAHRTFADDSPIKVYFLAADDASLIKIGSTENVDRRISALRRGSPVPVSLIGVIDGGAKKELELHERFAEHRVHGEWFSNIIRPEIDLLCATVEKFATDGTKYDVTSGEILDDNNVSAKLIATVATGMQTEAGRATLITAVDIMIAREEAEEDQPETATKSGADTDPGETAAEGICEAVTAGETATQFHAKASDDACEAGRKALGRAEASADAPDGAELVSRGVGDRAPTATSEAMDVTGGETAPHSKIALASQGEAEAPSVERVSPKNETSSVGANTGGDHVTSGASRAGQSHPPLNNGEDRDLPNARRLLRPNCQRPEKCGSGTKDHCWTCKKAMQGAAA